MKQLIFFKEIKYKVYKLNLQQDGPKHRLQEILYFVM